MNELAFALNLRIVSPVHSCGRHSAIAEVTDSFTDVANGGA